MMDRPSHPLLAAIAITAICTSTSALAAPPSPQAALALKPVQPDVEYERVPPDEADKCTVRDLSIDGWSGWEVVVPDGSLLRRFADTNEDKKVDLWCYYNFGAEVYRDIDENFNGKADQYRWLSTGGIRWGLDDDEDGLIDRWKQISAEEVTAEVVAALRDQDANRFSRLLISKSEIESLGLGRNQSERISTKADRAARDFEGLATRQKAVGRDAKWVQFAAASPGVVPSGTEGSTSDVIVYENAVAMFEQGEQSGQLMVGTLIRVGDTWRLVELPSVGDGETVAQTTGNFFTPGGSTSETSARGGSITRETQQLVAELETIDQKLETTQQASEIAMLHKRRGDIVEKLIAGSENQTERDTWVRQLVDLLSVGSKRELTPTLSNDSKRSRATSPVPT